VNIGFLPIIGLPLPLVSYGGSNLISTFAILGIIQGMISYSDIGAVADES
jgi:rod shape determining protein RodA